MALFGEKYGDVVRVVTFDPSYSVELCGGTHIGCTGEIGFFKIIHESAVAAGVRRVEAVSGAAAEQYINQQMQQLNEIRVQLKHPKDLVKSIENLQAELGETKKKIEKLEERQLIQLRKELAAKADSKAVLEFRQEATTKLAEVQNDAGKHVIQRAL